MKKSPKHGSAITQYIIILLLVCIVCIPAFFILGKSLFDYFSSFKSGMNNDNNLNITYTQPEGNETGSESINTESDEPNSNQKGSLGGTPANPKKECTNSVCTVDYGEFVLKGVPSDLSEHLKVSGSSGVTDYMAKLLDQITDQAKDSDLSEDELNLIKTLSNICHQIAVLESELESNALSLVNRYNQNGYFNADSGSDLFYQEKMNQLADLKIQMNDTISKMKSDEIISKIEDTDFAKEYEVVLQLGQVVTSRVNNFDEIASQINGSINDDNQLQTLSEFLELNASYKTQEDSQKICSHADGEDTGVECK